MDNKEDIFLIGLILVIIVLVVALFVVPQKVAEINPEGQASASIQIANPPREALQQALIVPETKPEQKEVPVTLPAEPAEVKKETPAPEPEATIYDVTLKDSRFIPDALTIKSGETVRWTNTGDYLVYQIDLVSYGRHTYSPKLKSGESWSISLTGPAIYYYNAVGYESRKARITVET